MAGSLLKLRNEAKSKKPEFERQDSNKYFGFKGTWRRPRGIHSKLRKNLRGHKAKPEIGYASPRSVKGLTHNGLKPIVVNNIKQLESLTKENSVILANSLGLKNRLILLNKIKEKGLIVFNYKDVDAFTNKAKEKFESKKKEKKSKQTKKEKVKQEAEKKTENKKSENAKVETKENSNESKK